MIAVEVGNGSLDRVLPVAIPEDIITVNHLFFSTSPKKIFFGTKSRSKFLLNFLILFNSVLI